MIAKISGKKLVIEMELNDPRPSKSGKTLVVATSGGNQATTCTIKLGKGANAVELPVKIGVNAFVSIPDGFDATTALAAK